MNKCIKISTDLEPHQLRSLKCGNESLGRQFSRGKVCFRGFFECNC